MQAQPGVMAPTSGGIRDVKDAAQKNGRCVNPPRYQTLGGMTGEGKWPTGSDYAVEKPTATRVGKRSYEKKV